MWHKPVAIANVEMSFSLRSMGNMILRQAFVAIWFQVLLGAGRTRQNFCLLCKRNCQQVLLTSATGVFRLDKILSDLTKLQRSRDKKSPSPLGSPIFCQAVLLHFFVCFVSQNPLEPSNTRAGMLGIMLIQKHAKLKSTSVRQQAFRSLSVPKSRFSAVSRSSWR